MSTTTRAHIVLEENPMELKTTWETMYETAVRLDGEGLGEGFTLKDRVSLDGKN